MHRILFVGRCEPEKGLDTLLCACRQLSKNLSIQLAIAGDGSLADTKNTSVQSLINGDAHDNVCRLGRQDGKTLSSLYRRAELVAMPSHFLETFGMSALEALSYAVPVMGPRKGGLIQFVHPDLDCMHKNTISCASIRAVILYYCNNDTKIYKEWSLSQAKKYSPEERLQQFEIFYSL